MLPFSGLDVSTSIAQVQAQNGQCPICGYSFSDYSECINDPATGFFLNNACIQLLGAASNAATIAGNQQSDVLAAAVSYVAGT